MCCILVISQGWSYSGYCCQSQATKRLDDVSLWWGFTSSIFWIAFAFTLLGCILEGNLQLCAPGILEHLREQVWFFRFNGCLSANPWKHAVVLGLLGCDADSTATWLWVRNPGGVRAPGPRQSVTKIAWQWLSQTTWDCLCLTFP